MPMGSIKPLIDLVRFMNEPKYSDAHKSTK